jgi:hypothetical protein
MNPEKAIYDRYPGFKTAICIWLKSPVIGNGLGSFYSLSFQYFPGDFKIFTDTLSYLHVHNEFLELLADGGILCLSAFLFLLVIAAKNVVMVINNSNYNKHIRYISCGIFSITVSLMLSNLFTLDLRYITIVYLFYVVLAMGYILPFIASSHDELNCSLHGKIRKWNSIGLISNQKSIFISIILLIISVYCWHGLKPYFMSDKGMNDAVSIETEFMEIFEGTHYSQFEQIAKEKIPMYIKIKNNPDFIKKIRDEKLIQVAGEKLVKSNKNGAGYQDAMKNYLNCLHLFEGLHMVEYSIDKFCLSWQRDYIYALYKLAGDYANLAGTYKDSLDIWPDKRYELLKGLYQIYDTSYKYYDKIHQIIPKFRNITQWRAQSYFYEGIINHEINTPESAKDKLELSLKYFKEYEEQDCYDIETRTSILFLCAVKNDYNAFLNEFKELIKQDIYRKFYFKPGSFDIEFPGKSNDVTLSTSKQKYHYAFGEKYIKKIFNEIDKQGTGINKVDEQLVKIAGSIGNMYKSIPDSGTKWASNFDILWSSYIDFVYMYSHSSELKKAAGEALIDLIRPEFINAYKNKEWNMVYIFYNQLKKYKWDGNIYLTNYDSPGNRKEFLIQWDLKKDEDFELKEWDKAVANSEFKMMYNKYLDNIFYYDLLKKNHCYKELTAYENVLKSNGIDVDQYFLQ